MKLEPVIIPKTGRGISKPYISINSKGAFYLTPAGFSAISHHEGQDSIKILFLQDKEDESCWYIAPYSEKGESFKRINSTGAKSGFQMSHGSLAEVIRKSTKNEGIKVFRCLIGKPVDGYFPLLIKSFQ